MGQRRSREERAAIVRAFDASGLTRREFSERRGIAVTTLDSWRRQRAGGLVEVNVESEATPGAFRLSLRNGRQIEGTWNFTDVGLARLIRIAESA